jgi:CBS domain-containing protein
MTVAEIMTRDVLTIRGLATVSEAVKRMQEKRVRSLVIEKRHPQDAYGIVTETDVINKVAAYGIDPGSLRVYEIMTKPCLSVNPDLAIEYAARLFAQAQIHHALVLSDRLEGIVTASDIFYKSDFLNNPKEYFFENELEKAIAKAKQICEKQGHDSTDCKVAWRIVEELQAEFVYQRSKKLKQTALEDYLDEYPEFASNFNLDNWCSG